MSDNNMDLEVARQLIEKDKLKRERAKLATKRYRERIISKKESKEETGIERQSIGTNATSIIVSPKIQHG